MEHDLLQTGDLGLEGGAHIRAGVLLDHDLTTKATRIASQLDHTSRKGDLEPEALGLGGV